MMKLGTITSDLKKIQKKCVNHMTLTLSSAEISIFPQKLVIFVVSQRRRSGIVNVNFEYISYLVLVFLLLTLDM